MTIAGLPDREYSVALVRRSLAVWVPWRVIVTLLLVQQAADKAEALGVPMPPLRAVLGLSPLAFAAGAGLVAAAVLLPAARRGELLFQQNLGVSRRVLAAVVLGGPLLAEMCVSVWTFSAT